MSFCFAAAQDRAEKKLQFFIRNPIPQEIDVQMFSFQFYYVETQKKEICFQYDDADFSGLWRGAFVNFVR